MFVMTKLFEEKKSLFLIIPFSSVPKTAEQMILAEFLWKASKLTPPQ